MEFWTCHNFQRVTGGRWLIAPPDDAAPIASLNIDTRTLQPGQAYLALRGENHDGHRFIADAGEKGVALVIADNEAKVISDFGFLISDLKDNASLRPGSSDGQYQKSEVRNQKFPILLVPNTLTALHQLASAWRDALAQANCTVIAVAGSNGKTTTRHLIHTVLSRRRHGTQSPKSFNNHIGVPLTLLAARREDDFVVCEIGTNHPGEIAQLAAIVRPDVAVITSIGEEHLEFFGSVANVAKEEASLLCFVRPDGAVFLPDDARLAAALPPWPTDVQRRPFATARDGRATADGCTFVIDDIEFTLPLRGDHNIDNACAAVAVGRWLGIAMREAAAALAAATPLDGRMQEQHLPGNVRLLHDAYNANPTSMLAVLRVLGQMSVKNGGRRVAILGDMLELGEHTQAAHRSIGAALAEPANQSGARYADVLITIGEHAQGIAEELQRRRPDDSPVMHAIARWSDDLPQRIAGLIETGDVVLLKASRGMRLERLIPALEQRGRAAMAMEPR